MPRDLSRNDPGCFLFGTNAMHKRKKTIVGPFEWYWKNVSERVWEQTGPGSACRGCACQLLFIPVSFFLLFPFVTQTPSCFLKIHSSVAQLFCRGWSVTCFIRGNVRSCNVVSYAAHTQQWGLICLCWPVGGSSVGEEQLWRHLQPDNMSLGFRLLFSASEDYFLLLLSYLFYSFLFWSSLIFLSSSLWGITSCIVFLEVGRIHDLVKYGLRTGNRRGMNG